MPDFRTSNPIAIILAAGCSSRMGATKPLVEIDGIPMLLRAANCFQEAGISEIIVVTGFDADKVGKLAGSHGMRPIFNNDYRKGMFTSICAGLRASSSICDAAFILPVDIPFVLPRTVVELKNTIMDRPIVIPRYGKISGHPPIIHRALFSLVENWDGENGLRGFFDYRKADIEYLEVDDANILLDIDTKADLKELLLERARLRS